MSGYGMNAESAQWQRSYEIAKMIFPEKFKGKFFRDAAKRLCKCTSLTYEQALKEIHDSTLITTQMIVMGERSKDADEG